MYKIAFTSPSNKHSQFVNDLDDPLNLNTVFLESINDIERIEEYDGIIIKEPDVEYIFPICEIIINLRKQKNIFIWIITAGSSYSERLIYFQLGVDGVVDSSYDLKQLKWVINNTLNRYHNNLKMQPIVDNTQTKKNDVKLLPANLSVLLNNDKEISLTRLEYRAMELLNSIPNQTFTYKEIYEYVWQTSFKADNYRVSNIIFHLRNKIESNPLKAQWIKTTRSKGYRLNIK